MKFGLGTMNDSQISIEIGALEDLMDLMDPMNPMGPMNPMDPMDPMNPMNPFDPMNPMNPLNPIGECQDYYSIMINYAKFALILRGYIGTLVCGAGVVAGIITAYVLATSSKLWTGVRLYLLTLTIWDISLLLSSWIFYSFVTIVNGGFPVDFGQFVQMLPYVNYWR